MKRKDIKQIIRILEEKLPAKTSKDFIGDLFEQRAEDIYAIIVKNEEYRNSTKEIYELEDKMLEIIKNSDEVNKLVERHYDKVYERCYLSDKLMYKHGVLDGLRIIIEGTKPIDIGKFLKDNK